MAYPPYFSLEDKEIALRTLILCGGNMNETRAQLKETGAKVPSKTMLTLWPKQDPQHFAELQAELADDMAQRLAAGAEQIAKRIEEAEFRAAEQALQDDEGADRAAARLRNLSTAKALQVDKISSPLRGRPNVIHASADVGELISQLQARLGIRSDADSDAVEIEEEPDDTGSSGLLESGD